MDSVVGVDRHGNQITADELRAIGDKVVALQKTPRYQGMITSSDLWRQRDGYFEMLQILHRIPLISEDQIIQINESLWDQLCGIKRTLESVLIKLDKDINARLPQDSAAWWRERRDRMGPDRDEIYRRAAEYNLKHEAAMKTGGPWKHFDCGTSFPMPPGQAPVCPRCEPENWEAAQKTKSTGPRCDAELVSGARFPTERLAGESYGVGLDKEAWPGTCKLCGGPAYEGLNIVDCKNKCGGS